MSNCGGTPEMWERQVRIGYVCEVLGAIARTCGSTDGKPDPTDPRIQAQAAMVYAVQKIRQRHREATETPATGTGDGSNGG